MGQGHFFISRNSTINGFRLPSNKIPTSQHWKPPSCTEPSHWLHLLWSKHGQSSSQLVGGWRVLVLGMSQGGRGAMEGQMPTRPDTSPNMCPPAWGHKATPHTSPNTCLPAQGCKVAPKTPFTTCHTGDAASGAAAPGRRLCCLFTGNKAAAARVRNSTLPQTAALENPSSTFPHVALHPVSNLQETKRPGGVIRGCET